MRIGPFLDDGIPHTLDDNERGRKDTVRVNPNEVVDIIVRFEVFSGRYMYHCHILDGMPSLTHDQVMTTTALDATQVIPRVRELLDRERLPGPEDVAEPTKATG